MSDTLTVTNRDITRIGTIIEASNVLEGEDLAVLEAVFFLAGRAASDLEPEVEGFMPAYMKLGDIKGEATDSAVEQFSFNFGIVPANGLARSFNLGATTPKRPN